MAKQNSQPVRCPHCHAQLMAGFNDRLAELIQKPPPHLGSARDVDHTGNDEAADAEMQKFVRDATAMISSDNGCAVLMLKPNGGSRAEYALDSTLDIVRMIRCLQASIRDLKGLAERHGVDTGTEDATDG